MVYARWYFCYQAKVSAEDTMRYLEILSVIEEDNRSGKGKLRALAGLERMEMLLQGICGSGAGTKLVFVKKRGVGRN